MVCLLALKQVLRQSKLKSGTSLQMETTSVRADPTESYLVPTMFCFEGQEDFRVLLLSPDLHEFPPIPKSIHKFLPTPKNT